MIQRHVALYSYFSPRFTAPLNRMTFPHAWPFVLLLKMQT